MKPIYRTISISLVLIYFFSSGIYAQSALIINHTSTNISTITESEINLAKSTLHIAYGHTSHGSQITDGMSGLAAFANGHGKGLNLPNNIFQWNNGGTGGALDLHDGAMGGDVGYYPDWVNNTRNYLNNPANSNVNVIMWSWCGQVSGKYSSGTLFSEYLGPMTQLETDYPDVKFVYMTGHLDHGNDANNKAANDSIRNYCQRNGKILFDFADIESYNPDGVFYQYADDACNYYSSRTDGSADGNWAVEWRNTHTQNVDWYSCSSAHSDALNANQKAFAAWRMWVEIAERILPVELTTFTASLCENKVFLYWQTATEIDNYGFEIERSSLGTMPGQDGWLKIGFVPGNGNSNSPKEYSFIDDNPPAGDLKYRLKQIDTNGNYEYYSTLAEVNKTTGVDEKLLTEGFILKQNYPNPFNPSTSIKYALPKNSYVTLEVYNTLGEKVTVLLNEAKNAGNHEITFDGKNLSSGIYIYKLAAYSQDSRDQFVKSVKMILAK